jgi:hypothetical protein
MTTRFTKVRVPKESRTALTDWILEQTAHRERDEVVKFLLMYFTTVDLDLIKQDMIARKDLTTLE